MSETTVGYVALLRAVNVGGTGKLPMAQLRAMCQELGFANVRTYIASGNALFESNLKEFEVKARLEKRLEAFAGKPVPVLVRSAAEMAAIVGANPFPNVQGSRHLVYFMDEAPTPDLIAGCRDIQGERLALGLRELYVDYGDGIRHTKLKIPGEKRFTARNINTVTKLNQMLSGL